MKEITIPKNVKHLDHYTFRLCEKLQAIHIAGDNPFFCSKNGMVYSKDEKQLLLCPIGHNDISTACLDGVEEIGYHAFAFNPNLFSLTIPPSVHTIHSGAFYCCEHLTSIELHPNIRMDGCGHFSHCTALNNITFFNTEGIIPADEFSGCENLSNVSLEGKFTRIESSAFKNTKIVTLSVPQGVTAINQDAFRFCKELKTVSLPKSVSRIHKDAFAQSGQIYLPDDGSWQPWHFVTGTVFHIVKGSKAERFCQELGYSIAYV